MEIREAARLKYATEHELGKWISEVVTRFQLDTGLIVKDVKFGYKAGQFGEFTLSCYLDIDLPASFTLDDKETDKRQRHTWEFVDTPEPFALAVILDGKPVGTCSRDVAKGIREYAVSVGDDVKEHELYKGIKKYPKEGK